MIEQFKCVHNKINQNVDILFEQLIELQKRIDYFENKEKEGIYVSIDEIQKCQEAADFKILIQKYLKKNETHK